MCHVHDLASRPARTTANGSALGRYLGMGSYAEWTEAAKLAWLGAELHSRRPLVPNSMPMDPEVKCLRPMAGAALSVVCMQSCIAGEVPEALDKGCLVNFKVCLHCKLTMGTPLHT